MPFILTAKQQEALRILAEPDADHVALAGGSRSGKTCLLLYATLVRALKCPGSRHCAVRQTFRDAKQKLGMQTLPSLHNLVGVKAEVDKSNWVFHYPGGSELWLCGLDDVDNRDARILGSEYSTILYDEASDIPWNSIQIANTRLAQRNDLRKRDWYAFNPPTRRHFLHSVFVEHQDPIDRRPLHKADHYRIFFINPRDNLDNIDREYLERLQGLSARERRRFLDGEWGDLVEGALWRREWIEDNRITQVRESVSDTVVGVDPACGGTCETGIVAVARGESRQLYLLADRSSRGTPAEWALAVMTLAREVGASRVVAEANQGGEMITALLKNTDPALRVELIHARQSKTIRAEPIAAEAERGRLHHVGQYPELEDQMLSFVIGGESPDRLDAAVHACAALLAGLEGAAPSVAGSHARDTVGAAIENEEVWETL